MVHSTHTHSLKSVFACENIHGARGGVPLYDQVGFCLSEGAVLAVTAPNGFGKTTLLAQVAGFRQLRSGAIHWFDQPVTSPKSYGGDMLYIGDSNGLYPELTVGEQLDYIARAFGQRERLAATVHYLELGPYMDVAVAALSAGWKRRLALSRLLLIPALLWLLDEPFAHLDAHASALVAGMIHSHAERGGLTILTAPQVEAAPKFYHTPVSVLQLTDFTPASAYPSDA